MSLVGRDDVISILIIIPEVAPFEDKLEKFMISNERELYISEIQFCNYYMEIYVF